MEALDNAHRVANPTTRRHHLKLSAPDGVLHCSTSPQRLFYARSVEGGGPGHLSMSYIFGGGGPGHLCMPVFGRGGVPTTCACHIWRGGVPTICVCHSRRRGVPGHRCTCAGLHPHIGLFSTWKVTPPSLSLSTSVELARTAPGVCTPPLLRAPIQQFDTFENKNDSTRDRWHRVGSARKRREENDRSIGKGGERLCVSQG